MSQTPASSDAPAQESDTPAPPPPPPRQGLKRMPLAIGGLILALGVWCLYLAVGTAIFRREGEQLAFDSVKFSIVIVTSGLFLGGWLLMLALYRPRPRRTDLPMQPPTEGKNESTDETKKVE